MYITSSANLLLEIEGMAAEWSWAERLHWGVLITALRDAVATPNLCNKYLMNQIGDAPDWLFNNERGGYDFGAITYLDCCDALNLAPDLFRDMFRKQSLKTVSNFVCMLKARVGVTLIKDHGDTDVAA